MSHRVWAYTISKSLTEEQQAEVLAKGIAFVNHWTAHEQKLSASFSIEHERIILVKVDEQVYGASGCSIDKLTRFVKQLENEYAIELMNRLLVVYEQAGRVEVVNAAQVRALLESKVLSPETLIYNTAVANADELAQWKQPLKETWLKKYL